MTATLKLVCRVCRDKGEGAHVYEFKLATYEREHGWTSRGYSTETNGEMDEDLDAWFRTHAHGSPRGDEILMTREEP